MNVLIIVVFVLGYVAIASEEFTKVDKSGPALISGILCWIIYALTGVTHDAVLQQIMITSYEITEIVFFLFGAMTIVELIDVHEGFAVITSRIKTRSKRKLLVILGILTFFMSAVLDNLTTAIVMGSLLNKLMRDQENRWYFSGLIIIAANAGGVWSPIGNPTSTLLWVGGQLSVSVMIKNLFVPSLVAFLVPLFIMTKKMKGEVRYPDLSDFSVADVNARTTKKEKVFVFSLGVFLLLLVPVVKVLTGLPPFMGMLLSLGLMITAAEVMHRKKQDEQREYFGVGSALEHVDHTNILFFMGILFSVAALSYAGYLGSMAAWLERTAGDVYVINGTIGVLSAIIANVPLVAASMKMYAVTPDNMAQMTEWQSMFVKDGVFWQFLALCSGVGGSPLILGSAAGVAIKGIQKIGFFWYVRKISWIAFVGFLAGALVYIAMQ